MVAEPVGNARIEARRDLLHRLGLVGGLGSFARTFAGLACQVSAGAWAGNKGNQGAAINGGSPLEVSVRSDRWPEVRFATCIGAADSTPWQRLCLGAAAARYMSRGLASRPAVNPGDWKCLAEWIGQPRPGDGRFGCFLGVSLTRDHFRVKFYLDLFGGGEAAGKNAGRQALAGWYRLLKAFGQRQRETGELHRLLPGASPVIACIEWDSRGQHHWKLYWRLKVPGVEVMAGVGDFFGVPGDVCRGVYHAFGQASGGYSRHPPVTGFVHGAPGYKGALGFYSSAPSRWGYSDRKQRQIRKLWEDYGGEYAVLSRVWQLARGSVAPGCRSVLTILGIGISARNAPVMTAYFCPPARVKVTRKVKNEEN
jgi:hypothetical protein